MLDERGFALLQAQSRTWFTAHQMWMCHQAEQHACTPHPHNQAAADHTCSKCSDAVLAGGAGQRQLLQLQACYAVCHVSSCSPQPTCSSLTAASLRASNVFSWSLSLAASADRLACSSSSSACLACSSQVRSCSAASAASAADSLPQSAASRAACWLAAACWRTLPHVGI